ncbi:MAG: hypothetical protein IT270_06770 [Saprospiraceae bacterium]|nr:hypothetical protein [Saprospiraceae bacterium]
MSKKIRFFALVALLLFARGCDFYSTSLWFFQPGGMQGESNPLTKYFGVGWNGLIIANIIVVGFFVAAYYYYSFRYKPGPLPMTFSNFREFVSVLYFGEKGSFFKIFYKIPKNTKAALAHTGYIAIRVIIIGSFLATIHNLCQFYDVPWYNAFRIAVGKPHGVIFGIFLASLFYFQHQVLKKAYWEAVKNARV